MLTINQIRENRDFIIERLKVKNFNAEEIVRKIIDLDASRREIQTRTDLMQNEMNLISKEIGSLIKSGKKDEAEAAKQKTFSLKEEIKELSERLIPVESELKNEIVRWMDGLLKCSSSGRKKVQEYRSVPSPEAYPPGAAEMPRTALHEAGPHP